MPTGGVIISVRDDEVLPIYLAHGVFGQKIRLGIDGDPTQETYIRVLSEIAGCRKDDHVFFRCRGRLYYGGRIRGSSEYGAFYLNGRRGFLGERAEAPLVWDESKWDQQGHSSRGAQDSGSQPQVCQPFLLRFKDWLHLTGRWIDEYRFYFGLREYNYLLPSTWMYSNMVSLSPGEVGLLLTLLMEGPDGTLRPTEEIVESTEEPVQFDPAFGPELSGARSREELMAAALAAPGQLIKRLQPEEASLGHHVPISPHRPRNVETTDIGYYSDRSINDGTLPDVLLYLDPEPAGGETRRRIERQYEWLETLLGKDIHKIKLYAVAPEFTADFYESAREETAAALDEVRFSITRTGL